MVVVVFETDGDWSEEQAKQIQRVIMNALPKSETMGRWVWFWTSCPEEFEQKVLDYADEISEIVSDL